MLRSIRALGVSMNSEMLYAFLMGTGWFFLMGWLLALVVAYAKAFRDDAAAPWPAPQIKNAGLGGPAQHGKLR